MDYDVALTQLVHQRARDLGADLVGIAGVERYRHAPALLSPQGHLPEASSVIVVALHHTDGAVEMGGRSTPHEMGPYDVQGAMNARNEHIVWCLARFIEEHGWRALPMPATNIWRFRPYGGLQRPFVPDISNIHAAAAAGLGEIGYSGLLLTPEFGPRQRLCTLITDAPLQPTPLYRGQPLCDRCLMCARHCPTQAFDKEVQGECEVVIEDKVMRYANKNMWRCSWAEHYGLSLDLPIPEVVTEQILLDHLAAHGRRGGELGSCLRFCLPPQLRHYDPGYTDTVRRRLDTSGEGRELDRPATWQAHRIAFDWGAVVVAVADEAACRDAGISLSAALPDGRRLVAFAFSWPQGSSVDADEGQPCGEIAAALGDLRDFAEHDIARQLERLGYAAIPHTGVRAAEAVRATGMGRLDAAGNVVVDGLGRRAFIGAVITSAPLQVGRAINPSPRSRDLWSLLRCLAGRRISRGPSVAEGEQLGGDWLATRFLDALMGTVDLIGVAPVSRLDELVSQLDGKLDTEAMGLAAVDRGDVHGPVRPEVQARREPVLRRPAELLEGASSVVVLGTQVPAVTLQRATEPPADAVGPCAYAVCQARRELRYAAYWLAQALGESGYRATVVDDLLGTGSLQANPRGPQPDFRCSALAAVAAGLGHLLHTGAVWTPEYDTRVLFISVVTDAPLPPSPLLDEAAPCAACDRPCVAACPTKALSTTTVTVEMEGRAISFGALDWLRCEWAKRYGLVGAEGPRWIGSLTDIYPPDGEVTPGDLLSAYAQLDPSQKHFLCIVEPCLRACHLHLRGRQN